MVDCAIIANTKSRLLPIHNLDDISISNKEYSNWDILLGKTPMLTKGLFQIINKTLEQVQAQK